MRDREPQLSEDEAKELERCEKIIEECGKIIEASATTDYKRAKALATIHERKLFRPVWETFENYCQKRLKLTRQHAYRLLDYYRYYSELKGTKVLPSSERQTRELKHLPPEKWRLAWDLAVLSSGSGPVSGTHVRAVVDRLRAELGSSRRRRFGEAINFEGLRHAPINELGVVFLFGLISHRLGFTVESVQSGFPDCMAKRVVDRKRNHLEQIEIEFEYESRSFRKHGHDSTRCDLLVCWIDNWPECPIPVMELKGELRKLMANS